MSRIENNAFWLQQPKTIHSVINDLMSYICTHQTKPVNKTCGHLPKSSYTSSTYLRILHILSAFNLKNLGNRYSYYPHFTNEETEAQKVEKLAHCFK